MKLKQLLVILIFAACSFKKNDLSNQTMKGHEQLYSHPDSAEEADSDYKRIVIASTNDIQGQFGPTTLTFEDKHKSGQQQISVGGVDYISGYFKILREVFGNVLLVDSGDIFTSNTNDLKSAAEFYGNLKYDAITVGLTDFNLQLPKETTSSSNLIKDFAKDSPTPLLLSNLYELKTARGVEWTGTKPYIIKEINGIKIAVLGIVPNDIVDLTPVDNRVGLYVENMVQNTLWYGRLVRSLGAQLVVVLTHQGVDCGSKIASSKKLPLNKVNFEPQKENVCDMTGLMGEYLNRLPPHLVDVVIGGRNHQKMANIHNGMVLLSGFENGKSFNFAEFNFEKKTGKLLKDKTVVHQPVMFCHEFFKETDDCFTEDSTVDHRAKIPATFLGKVIVPDQSLKDKFTKFYNEKTVSQSSSSIIDQELLKRFGADLAFKPHSAGNTQLITIEIKGRLLSRLLEEKFNNHQLTDWWPLPYKLKGNLLGLQIQKENLDLNRKYRILSDIESLQHDHNLRRFITADHSLSLNLHSWNSLQLESDDVSLQMAATQRQ